jgi:hypothetical protein
MSQRIVMTVEWCPKKGDTATEKSVDPAKNHGFSVTKTHGDEKKCDLPAVIHIEGTAYHFSNLMVETFSEPEPEPEKKEDDHENKDTQDENDASDNENTNDQNNDQDNDQDNENTNDQDSDRGNDADSVTTDGSDMDYNKGSPLEFIKKYADPHGEWLKLVLYPRVREPGKDKFKILKTEKECPCTEKYVSYKNGLVIKKIFEDQEEKKHECDCNRKYKYHVLELTYGPSEDDGHSIRTSMDGHLDQKGEVIDGYIDCFSLGFYNLNPGTANEIFADYLEHFKPASEDGNGWKWDVIEKK